MDSSRHLVRHNVRLVMSGFRRFLMRPPTGAYRCARRGRHGAGHSCEDLLLLAEDLTRERASSFFSSVVPSVCVTMHHPVFSQFDPHPAKDLPEGCEMDSFLGTIYRSSHVNISPDVTVPKEWSHNAPSKYFDSYPEFSEEYFEWIDLLESVVEASDSYTFVELGAGFGRWSARATFAARQRGIEEIRLVAVEPERNHFSWLSDHLALNGIDPSKQVLIRAAVARNDGTVPFACGPRSKGQSEYLPDHWYGQAIHEPGVPEDSRLWRNVARKVLKLEPRAAPGFRIGSVPSVSLETVFQHCGVVDLMDLDVQGAELDVLSTGIELLNDRVRRLHIGTHSHGIEVGLKELLPDNEWILVADWPLFSTNETPFGTAYFNDGVQSWCNPRLPGP
jgi:FkbM family methyltransferase